ncbi:MAG: lysozyme inhibitor LprI family protein [Hyphomicrobiales bacterium]
MKAAIALTVLLLAILGQASPTFAQYKPNCADWGNLPQQDMNQCAGIAYDEADAELNRVWGDLRERRGEGHSWDVILEAQRAWIPFRDAHCESVAAPYEGGSIQPLIRSTCLTDVTEQRTAQLREFLLEP